MASEILLASFNYYYDYEGETSTNELQYLPDTVEFRLYELYAITTSQEKSRSSKTGPSPMRMP